MDSELRKAVKLSCLLLVINYLKIYIPTFKLIWSFWIFQKHLTSCFTTNWWESWIIIGYVVKSGGGSLIFSATECNRLYSKVRYPVQCQWSVGPPGVSPWASSIFIFINDIPSSKTRLFADYFILYRPIHDQSDCIILQRELEIADWEHAWGMS